MGAKVMPPEKTTIKRHMKMDTNESLVIETIARMKGIPTREELMKQLAEEVLTVTFLKLDGDQRVMTCTLVPTMIPKATVEDPLSQKKVRAINEKVCSVWDVNAQGWRSFRYDRVQKVESADSIR